MNRCCQMLAGIGTIMLTLVGHGSASGLDHKQPASGHILQGKFTSYHVPYASPYGIVYNNSGPLKGIWFTNATMDATSGAVEFSYKTQKTSLLATPTPASKPGSINFIPGSDNSLWFTETSANKIARIDPSRKITEYAIPTADSKPLDIQHGPDGAMWFAQSGVGKIGRIDSTGKITEYQVGAENDKPTALITQAGALWFTEVGTGRIGRLTTSGDVSHFATGSGKLTGDMTNTNDGSIWAPKATSVVRLKSDGSLTEFPLKNVVSTGQIFGHNDGVLIGAIKADGQGAILSVSATGKVNAYNLPSKHLLPIEMAADPDGGFFVTVRSYPSEHPVSTIWRLQ